MSAIDAAVNYQSQRTGRIQLGKRRIHDTHDSAGRSERRPADMPGPNRQRRSTRLYARNCPRSRGDQPHHGGYPDDFAGREVAH